MATKNPKTTRRMGGNAPVMVKNFLKLGYEVLLGAQMSDEVKEMIGPDASGTILSHETFMSEAIQMT